MFESDETLLRHWAERRDAKAFRDIVRRHGRMVLGVCRRMLQNDEDARDTTQDCFTELVHCEDPGQIRNLGPWLHGVAVNICRVRIRGDNRQCLREERFSAGLSASVEPAYNDLAPLLDEALHTLPDEVREPLVAHYYLGRSHGAIARAGGIPRRTVSHRIQRGLALLGASLRARGVTATSATLAAALMSARAEAAVLPGGWALETTRHCLGTETLPGTLALTGSKAMLITVLLALAIVPAGIWMTHAKSNDMTVAMAQGDESTPATASPAELSKTPEPPQAETVPPFPDTSVIAGTVLAKDTVWFPARFADLARLDDQEAIERGWSSVFREDTEPRAGVRVELKGQVAAEHGGQGLHLTTISDDQGRYHFGDLPPGSYEVALILPPDAVQIRPEKDRDGRKKLAFDADETRVDMDLVFRDDAVSCTGRVTGPAGRPISGAEVSASPIRTVPASGDDGFDRIQTLTLAARTDRDGHYQLQGMMPANYREAANGLCGRIDSETGSSYMVRADADGFASSQVAITAITPDTLAISKVIEQFATEEGRDALQIGATKLSVGPGRTLSKINLVLVPEARISGIVSDTRGNPMPGVRLRLVREDSPKAELVAFLPHDPEPEWVTTDDSGGFDLTGVAKGTYAFEVNAGEGDQRARNAPFAASPGDRHEGIVVVVESAADRGDIAGVVTDATTGNPVGPFEARVTGVVSPSEPSPRLGRVEANIEAGAFTILGVSEGVATVEVKADGYPAWREEVTIEAGSAVPLRMRVPKGGISHGTVRRNGEASANGYVTFLPKEDNAPYSHINGEGAYEVRDLKPGTHLVRYTMWLYEDRRGGAQASCYRSVEILPGEVTQVDIDYEGHGVVEGSFIAPPDAKLFARLYDHPGRAEEHLRLGSWKFDKNARYELVDIPPGSYTLVAICTSPDGTEREQTRSVTLTGAETITEDFHFP